jgi:hypothetical protein
MLVNWIHAQACCSMHASQVSSLPHSTFTLMCKLALLGSHVMYFHDTIYIYIYKYYTCAYYIRIYIYIYMCTTYTHTYMLTCTSSKSRMFGSGNFCSLTRSVTIWLIWLKARSVHIPWSHTHKHKVLDRLMTVWRYVLNEKGIDELTQYDFFFV